MPAVVHPISSPSPTSLSAVQATYVQQSATALACAMPLCVLTAGDAYVTQP